MQDSTISPRKPLTGLQFGETPRKLNTKPALPQASIFGFTQLVLPCLGWLPQLHVHVRDSHCTYSPAKKQSPIFTHHPGLLYHCTTHQGRWRRGGQNSWAQEEITQGAKDKKEGGKKCNVESALRAWRTEGACWRKRLKRKVRWSKIAK